MRRVSRFSLAALLAIVLAAAPPAAAQAPEGSAADATPHLLEIRDGAIWLDGRQLPDSAVPEDLDLAGLSMSVEYSGPVTPVVEVDGVAYVLQDERLIRFDESARAGSQVYFLGEAAPAEPAAPPPPAATLVREGAEREAAADAAGRDRDDRRLRRAGEEAYMQELSATDRALYNQIRREAELDAEAGRLAGEIRGMPAGNEREAGVERLRSVLAEAFDLKQQIREAEIQRAEQQVEDLRSMLRARNARKTMIVEHRLRELLGY
jgi:hypothetical protein